MVPVPTWSSSRTSSKLQRYASRENIMSLAVSYWYAYQKIVCDELDEVFGSDKEKEIDAAGLAKLRYLEMCIKESLRLFPSVPIFGRLATQDVELGEISTEKP